MDDDLRPEPPDAVEEHDKTRATDRVDVVEGPVGSASIKPLEEARSADIDLEALPAIDVADKGARPR